MASDKSISERVVMAMIRMRSSACFLAGRPSACRSSGDLAESDDASQRSFMAKSEAIVVCVFIPPTHALRELARSIIGPSIFLEVYAACSFAECERRDVKGGYAQVKSGEISNFTGRDSIFAPSTTADLILDTEKEAFDVLVA